MIGESLSHYRVTDQIGRGGMGIVYRAEDTRLDRTVALKLLPPHALASEDDRARFYREARAAAALSHPNVAHIYEIDEAMVEGGESRPFIAMEFIDGETLGERISKGPLPLKDAVTIATQIADGLKAAHEKNIVHRDIKSGNVMLTKEGFTQDPGLRSRKNRRVDKAHSDGIDARYSGLHEPGAGERRGS